MKMKSVAAMLAVFAVTLALAPDTGQRGDRAHKARLQVRLQPLLQEV